MGSRSHNILAVLAAIFLWVADATIGSCQGNCNGQFAIDCWCEESCIGYGDCCSDFTEWCLSKDCVLSEWSGWGECSLPCGGGTRSRSRSIEENPNALGEPCRVLFAEEICNPDPCPIECVMSDWEEWSECDQSCDGGRQSRTREITNREELSEDVYGGVSKCPAMEETRVCNTQPCAVDCQMSPWGAWTPCSAACGPGFRSRTRTTYIQPQFGGEPCPEPSETRECMLKECAVDCQLSDWTEWAQCSKPCNSTGPEDTHGPGTRKRTRNVKVTPLHGGVECDSLEEEEECNNYYCPIHCELGDVKAQQWGECSAECGGGIMFRVAPILKHGQHGGHSCPPENELPREEEVCGEVPCNADVVDRLGELRERIFKMETHQRIAALENALGIEAGPDLTSLEDRIMELETKHKTG